MLVKFVQWSYEESRLRMFDLTKYLFKHDIQHFEIVGSSQNNIAHLDT